MLGVLHDLGWILRLVKTLISSGMRACYRPLSRQARGQCNNSPTGPYPAWCCWDNVRLPLKSGSFDTTRNHDKWWTLDLQVILKASFILRDLVLPSMKNCEYKNTTWFRGGTSYMKYLTFMLLHGVPLAWSLVVFIVLGLLLRSAGLLGSRSALLSSLLRERSRWHLEHKSRGWGGSEAKFWNPGLGDLSQDKSYNPFYLTLTDTKMWVLTKITEKLLLTN